MNKEILQYIAETQPQISQERAEEILDDMKPAILSAISLAFRAWDEGISKRSEDERFKKGGWKDYIQDPTQCLDHMLNHLVNVIENDRDEEHLAHLISRCVILSYGGLFPRYKGTLKPIVLDTDEGYDEFVNEIEGEEPGPSSHDGE